MTAIKTQTYSNQSCSLLTKQGTLLIQQGVILNSEELNKVLLVLSLEKASALIETIKATCLKPEINLTLIVSKTSWSSLLRKFNPTVQSSTQ